MGVLETLRGGADPLGCWAFGRGDPPTGLFPWLSGDPVNHMGGWGGGSSGCQTPSSICGGVAEGVFINLLIFFPAGADFRVKIFAHCSEFAFERRRGFAVFMSASRYFPIAAEFCCQ